MSEIDASHARTRLDFVDGLRGIAALAVVLSHAIGMVPPDHPVLPIWRASPDLLLQWPFLFGKQMVWLFIMLSGFALYWSEESRRARGKGATGLGLFLKRRVWRILPTYYIALVVGAVVVVLFARYLLEPSASLATSAPVTIGGVISHLTLVHNLRPDWMYQLNPPLWSIAVEAQLYLLFPLFLVLRTRLTIYGSAALIVGAIFAANKFLPFAFFSLVELFAVGVIVAHVVRRWAAPPAPIWTVALLAVAVGLVRPGLPAKVEEALWAVAFAAVILGLVNAPRRWWNAATWTGARWLGARSYSLYVLHFPVALLIWAAVGRLGLNRPAEIVAVVLGTLLGALVAANLVWRWIEVPSQERSKNATTSTTKRIG
ncbi:hypothetical protein DEJ24_04955 [Curtobacterium sp. MCPF17_001]|uniref:acyltransferase family protein n=1 Tax=Curtobacterium sp. MCPF17_001 TaxID=2175651 RepID=UPI000DAA2E1F|nr:acyltransferase [Curtobacterium sp. MCPF17_001]PZE61607.1 hypothetical protein DEJ24_04955 [Curtobacterium sp. MCPF17_001]